MTLTAIIIGAVSMLASFALFFGGSSRGNDNGTGILGVPAQLMAMAGETGSAPASRQTIALPRVGTTGRPRGPWG